MKKKRLIIDASCIIAILKQEPLARDVLMKTAGYELRSAACLPFEIGNALSKLVKRNLLKTDEALNCFELFQKIPLSLLDVDFDNALQLAGEESHYCYDMYYLDCALRTGNPLLTYDRDLIAIAKRRGVTCL